MSPSSACNFTFPFFPLLWYSLSSESFSFSVPSRVSDTSISPRSVEASTPSDDHCFFEPCTSIFPKSSLIKVSPVNSLFFAVKSPSD